MNKLLVFGCGKVAERTHKYISRTRNRILYYIDNDKKKWGRYLFGKKIISPDSITNLKYDYILIASIYWREIRKQLLELGVDRSRIMCPMMPMNRIRFKKEYRDIYNVLGKIKFYCDKWYLVEQFHPDLMGIFVNPYFFSRRMLYEGIKKYSHYIRGGQCMDFGCGISPYKRLLPVDDYVGVEIDTDDKRAGIIYYDGHTLPFADESFDSIISSEVFEHVFNIEDIVMELNRVLKPGGIMLITVPFAYPKHCEPFDFKRYTMNGIKNLLLNAGFEFVEGESRSSYWECIAQLKNVYWAEEVKTKTCFGRFIINLMLVWNNVAGIIKRRVLPYSDKLYLDNVLVVRKESKN